MDIPRLRWRSQARNDVARRTRCEKSPSILEFFHRGVVSIARARARRVADGADWLGSLPLLGGQPGWCVGAGAPIGRRRMLLEDYVETIVQALGRVGRFQVEEHSIWTEVSGGRRRAEITLIRADVPRESQTTLTIEIAWEPTHTFLYQLDDLVEPGEGARNAVAEVLDGHERFCLDVIYGVELRGGAEESRVRQFLDLLDEKGVAGVTQVQVSGQVEGSVSLKRPSTFRFFAHMHDTAFEDRISFGYFLDSIITNLRHIDECRQFAGI